MTSNDILQLINKMEGKKRGAIAESIRHTVESTEELSKNTLWVAFSALRTAEAVDTLIEVLRAPQKSILCDCGGNAGGLIELKRVSKGKISKKKGKVSKEIPTVSTS